MSAGVVTVQSIMDAARYRADMVGSPFVTDAELLTYVTASQQELYDLLVTTYGEDYYATTASTITTDGLTDLYSLPTDFYKLLGASLLVSSGTPAQYVTLKPFAFQERDTLGYPGVMLRGGGLRYRLKQDKLWLRPFPASGQTIQLWYVPRLTIPTAVTDTVDGVNGWEEYIITDCAIKMLQKEESDCSLLMAQKAALVARINAAAANRDAGMPTHVVDVRMGTGGPYGYGTGEPFP